MPPSMGTVTDSLGPPAGGCCSGGGAGKYQRATSCLPGFPTYTSMRFPYLQGRRHREAVAALRSLTPCSAALAGADTAPNTLDANVWGPFLGNKVCQGSSAPMPGVLQPPGPWKGVEQGGSEDLAPFGTHLSATTHLLVLPQNGEGLWASPEETP